MSQHKLPFVENRESSAPAAVLLGFVSAYKSYTSNKL